MELALEAETVRRDQEDLTKDFRKFVEAAWPLVNTTPFSGGIHVDAICDHLQACAERRIKKLVINIPPRHGKSTITSVLFSAWVLARNPSETLLFASYSSALAIRDAVVARTLIESDWYKARWPHVALREDQNTKSSYITTAKGGRQTTSVGGTVTGLGGSFLVIDDPLNVSDADSPTERENANLWFKEAWFNRANGDVDQCVRIVIMQRLHMSDISALCEKMGFDMLVLETEFTARRPPTSIGWVDPRETPGELLWPQQWNLNTVTDLKTALGEYAYAAQYQQNPVPRGGGVIQTAWLRYWYDPLINTPAELTYVDSEGQPRTHVQVAKPAFSLPQATNVTPHRCASWDLAFKGTSKSDFVVGQLWATDLPNYYLLDQTRGRMDFVKTKVAITEFHEKWAALPTLVEEKANGAAIIAELREVIAGLVARLPDGDKHSRTAAIAPLFESGNIWLPHPAQFPWVAEYVKELTFFPKAPNDDQVDATSQALTYLRQGNRNSSVTIEMDLGPDGAEPSGLELESYWADG